MPEPPLLSNAAAKKVDRAVARLGELQSLLRDASSATKKKRATVDAGGFGRTARSPPTMSDGYSTTNPTHRQRPRTPLACTTNTRTQHTQPIDRQSLSKKTTSSSSHQRTQHQPSPPPHHNHHQHQLFRPPLHPYHHQHRLHEAENNNPGHMDRPRNSPPPRSRRTRLCSPRPTTSVSTAASTTLLRKEQPCSKQIRSLHPHRVPCTNTPPIKMPRKLLYVNTYPTNPNRPWHFSSSTSEQATTTSGQTTQTTTTSGQTTTTSGQTTTMSGKTNMISCQTTTKRVKTPSMSEKTSMKSGQESLMSRKTSTMSGQTSTTSGQTSTTSRETSTTSGQTSTTSGKTRVAPGKTSTISRKTSTLPGHRSAMICQKAKTSEETIMLSSETSMMSDEEQTMSPQKIREIPDQESTMSTHQPISWHDRLHSRSTRRSSLPNPCTSDCSGLIRPVTKRLASITKRSRRAFRASPEKISLPSLITRLPTRRRSTSMLWNYDQENENDEGSELTPSSVSNVLPLPPAFQKAYVSNGLGSSMGQNLLPPHNACKATTQTSCFIHMGKENCFSGCNPMALLRRSCSTPIDSGHYVLKSRQGDINKAVPRSQAYRVDSPVFHTWKPRPKLYFV